MKDKKHVNNVFRVCESHFAVEDKLPPLQIRRKMNLQKNTIPKLGSVTLHYDSTHCLRRLGHLLYINVTRCEERALLKVWHTFHLYTADTFWRGEIEFFLVFVHPDYVPQVSSFIEAQN